MSARKKVKSIKGYASGWSTTKITFRPESKKCFHVPHGTEAVLILKIKEKKK